MLRTHLTILVAVAALLAPVASSAQPVPAPHPGPVVAGPHGPDWGLLVPVALLALIAGALTHKH
ncbi:hypothetical protein [Aquicoccus sp. SU-CL01552]|uniref:hypothetical protein n=1 Tax=Aquicoccus sp. SU-CL01552 TaxID=3127656 RepID=UPI003106591E